MKDKLCKSEYTRLFDSIETKAKYFDEIAACFYDEDFGSMSKSDIELLMFNFFMKELIKKGINENNILDYSECSDYAKSR